MLKKILRLGLIAACAAFSLLPIDATASDPVPASEAPYAKKNRSIQMAADPATPTKAPSSQDQLLNVLASCSAKSPEGIPGGYVASRRSGRTWLHVSRAADGKFVVKSKNDFSITVLTEVNSYKTDGMTLVMTTMQTTSTLKYDPASKALSGTFPGGTISYSLAGC